MSSLAGRLERWRYLGARAVRVLIGQGPLTFWRLAYWKIRSIEAYDAWQARHELSSDDLERQREESVHFEYRPLISLLTPVYNPPVSVLSALLDSVAEQTYDRWELCIVEAGSDDPAIRRLLEARAAKDGRLKATFLRSNLGISENTNRALQNAAGAFVALVDHDDVLAPDLLYEVVRVLNEKPGTDLVYYDEDKLSPDGTQRRDPLFKPAWSPEMLLSANYLTHPVVRRALLEEAGGLNPATDGAQDWDLMLRLSERTARIEHIPRVLYHWRQLGGSTAGGPTAKPWVHERQLAAVRSHLERHGLEGAQAAFVRPGVLRAVWPTRGSKVSIVIPTKDKLTYLQRCVQSILKRTHYPEYEIIVVDTGSREEATWAYYERLADETRIRVVKFPGSFNYSAANNLGAETAAGDLLLFLNNDTEMLEPDWLEELVRWAERPEIGVVGARLLFPDETIQHAGVILGLEGHASHIFSGADEHQGTIFGSLDWYRNYLAVTGACLMTRTDLFRSLGGFDESFVLAFSDIEYCIRVHEAGHRIVYTPFARLRHYAGRSRGDYIPSEDLHAGYERFRKLITAGDPYFNPNLSYASRIPALRPADEVTQIERLDTLMKSHGVATRVTP